MKIKPCPFCGSHPIIEDVGVSGVDVINIYCDDIVCEVSVKTKTNGSLTQAINAWNNRMLK